MAGKIRFALNHMSAPSLDHRAFFQLAVSLGIDAVEIRNDLDGRALLDGTPAKSIAADARDRGLRILTVNALQRFNDWTAEREREAKELARTAADCGAEALVLVPVNDGSGRANGERQANVRVALRALLPILEDAGIEGFVEPLGFESCSLRLKSEALEAIRAVGGEGAFRLVHDTFHHHLAGEADIFPAETGLVHISGVVDAALAVREMRDGHRVLVDAADGLGNVAQIAVLRSGGYDGYLSFEPFSPAVHDHPDPAAALRSSMEFVAAGLR